MEMEMEMEMNEAAQKAADASRNSYRQGVHFWRLWASKPEVAQLVVDLGGKRMDALPQFWKGFYDMHYAARTGYPRGAVFSGGIFTGDYPKTPTCSLHHFKEQS